MALINKDELKSLRAKLDEAKSSDGEYLNLAKAEGHTYFFLEPLPPNRTVQSLMVLRHQTWTNNKPIVNRETLGEIDPGLKLAAEAKASGDFKELFGKEAWKNFSVNYDVNLVVRIVTFASVGSKTDFKKIASITPPTIMQMEQKAADIVYEMLADDKYDELTFIGYESVSVLDFHLETETKNNKKSRKYTLTPLLSKHDIPADERTPDDKLLDLTAFIEAQVATESECYSKVYEYIYGEAPAGDSIAKALS